jgi:hypothetical protein
MLIADTQSSAGWEGTGIVPEENHGKPESENTIFGLYVCAFGVIYSYGRW